MAAMDTSKPIEIFKTGTHIAMSGDALRFTEADLEASARAYDPAKHEAPIVVGHPRHDAPAYGWVKSLSHADGSMEAEPTQVDPAFAEMVSANRFKKVSASFYAPDAPNNPVPGVYYLRHVGFLGAQPPAVKGLRQPEFADGEQGVVEFADWGDMQVASIFRGLREWIIGRFGRDEADQVIPGYAVGDLEADARSEAADTGANTAPSFSEVTNDKGSAMSAEEKARLEAAEARNRTLEAELATERGAKRRAEYASFAEALVGNGKLLPAQREVVLVALDALGAGESLSFGEGDQKKPLVDAFKDMLTSLPKQVEFSESAGKDRAGDSTSGTVSFAAPEGFTVDTARMAHHNRVLEHQRKHNVTYDAALSAVPE
ncbi:MAG: peptidase [Rhodocyclales bacterium]|nr:peptidase [Rhodocyclales bacterium]